MEGGEGGVLVVSHRCLVIGSDSPTQIQLLTVPLLPLPPLPPPLLPVSPANVPSSRYSLAQPSSPTAWFCLEIDVNIKETRLFICMHVLFSFMFLFNGRESNVSLCLVSVLIVDIARSLVFVSSHQTP